ICVVPIGMGKVKIDLQAAAMRGIAQLLHHVTPQWRLHNAVCKVTRLDLRTACGSPVHTRPHPSFGVVHRKSFVMLRCKGEHLGTGLLEKRYPLISVKTSGIPGLVYIVVSLPFCIGQIKERPGFVIKSLLRIDSPMHTNAEFDIPKTFIGFFRGPVVFRYGYGLDILLDLAKVMIRGRKPVRALILFGIEADLRAESNCCRGKSEFTTVHCYVLRDS